MAVIAPPLPLDALTALCQHWQIRELALFGSVARGDDSSDSDVDLLVSFAPGNTYSLFDFADLKGELETLLGREVDLVEREALQNPIRKASVLRDVRVLYAAA